jgi:hypothetical protein
MLKLGKIRKFISFTKALILFVPKKDRKLRLYINYKGLNKVTIKNCYTFPLISKMLNSIAYIKVFSKINFKNAYYKLRIKKKDK